MSAAGAFFIAEENKKRIAEKYNFVRSFDPNYDIGLGMLEYPKAKHWKLVRKLFKKLFN